MTNETKEALATLEQEIYRLKTATRWQHVNFGRIKGAYSKLSKAVTGEEHEWTR